MGIVDFGQIVRQKYKKVKDVRIPKQIDSVFIDCNGVLYASEGSVYLTDAKKYTDEDRRKKYLKGEEALEQDFLNTVVKKIKDALDKFKPEKNFFVVIDGAANAAKMQQQKTRRFKSTKEADKEKAPNPFFSTRSFTPGTPMMIKIDKAIREWLKIEKNLPEKTLYSSHLDPGEAEHKIFEYIRRDQYAKGDGAHVIYGADNDLYILTLLCKENNLYLYKDNYDELYDMNAAKTQTLDFMKFKGCDESRLLTDFSILITFAGNDFLPQFPNIGSSIDSLNIVLGIYKENKSHLYTKDNNLDWRGLLMLFRKINKHTVNNEELYLGTMKLKYPYKELRESTIIKNIYGKVVDEVYDSSKHYRGFDLDKFSKLWYSKEFTPRCLKLRKMYKNKFYDNNDIEDMCLKYLKTIQWCHIYYTEGYKDVSNYHFYNYRYLPLTIDIETYLEKLIKSNQTDILRDVRFKRGEDFTTLEQLMMVLPPQSLDLIPNKYQKVYKEYLNSTNPVEFPNLILEGTSAHHHHLVLIPPIDIQLIKYVFELEKIKIPEDMKNKEPLILEGEKKIHFSLKIDKQYLM